MRTHIFRFFFLSLYLSLSLSVPCAGSPCKAGSLQTDAHTHTHTSTHQLSQIPSPCPRLAHAPHRLTGLPPLGGLRSQLVCGGHLCFPLSPLALFCWIGSHVPSPPYRHTPTGGMIIHVGAGRLVLSPCKWFGTSAKLKCDASVLRNADEYYWSQVCHPRRIIAEYHRVSTLPFMWESDS